MNNEITLQELLKGKATLIRGKEYYPTKTYIEPFLERVSAFTSDIKVQAIKADQISTSNKVEDTVYNRILLQAILPEKHDIDNHQEVIGLLYGLDVRKPVVKIFRNYLNKACLNMTVFSPQWINVQDMLPGEPINYSPIKSLMEYTNDFATILAKTKSTYLDRNARTQYLGEWVDYSLRESQDYGFGKVKIAVSTPIDAYKELFINQESEYYVPVGYDPTLYDVLNSFTDIISSDNKDILNKFEKLMIINRLLKIAQ